MSQDSKVKTTELCAVKPEPELLSMKSTKYLTVGGTFRVAELLCDVEYQVVKIVDDYRVEAVPVRCLV